LLVQVFPNYIALAILGGIFLVGRSASLNIARGFFSEFSDVYKATLIAVGDTIYYFSRSIGSAATGITLEVWGYDALFLVMALLIVASMAILGMVFLFKKKPASSRKQSMK